MSLEGTDVGAAAGSNSEPARVEWESTITVPTDERPYERAKTFPGRSKDTIFIWPCGTRLSGRRLERKITLSSKGVLIFFNHHWIPIVRTTAQELLVADHAEDDRILQVTFRYIVHRAEGIRVTYNKIVCDAGTKYTVAYEIEYAPGSPYDQVRECEQRLIQCYLERRNLDRPDGEFPPAEPMNSAAMFECVMTKLQNWQCFDANVPYRWAYKWNGVKAKLLLREIEPSDDGGTGQITAGVFYWTDLMTVESRSLQLSAAIAAPALALLRNVCCAIEIMDDRIVLLEAIGTRANGQIFNTEPQTNWEFLRALREICAGTTVTLAGKPLEIQQFFDPPKASDYDRRLYDGLVIIQGPLIIRWKVPTTDVKCVLDTARPAGSKRKSSTPADPATATAAAESNRTRSRTYRTGNGDIVVADIAGEPGTVYEMGPGNTILRSRIDRLAESSAGEYQAYLRSVHLLSPDGGA